MRIFKNWFSYDNDDTDGSDDDEIRNLNKVERNLVQFKMFE